MLKKRKVQILIISLFVITATLIMVYSCYNRYHKIDIILVNDIPDLFLASENSVLSQSENFIVVRSPESAVMLAKAYTRSIYNTSFHGPYTIYFNEDNQLYYISSSFSLLRRSIDIIINGSTGELIDIERGKF